MTFRLISSARLQVKMYKYSARNKRIWGENKFRVGEKDLYVTNDRWNEASFRQKLDPISKNVIRNQNPFEL